MATAGFKTRVLVGDFSYSSKLNDISLPISIDMHDVTTFADDGVKRFIPGQSTSTASLSGFVDDAVAADAATWVAATAATPLTYGQFGLSRGSKVQLVDALAASFEVGSSVAGVSVLDLSAQTDGFTDFGVSLKDLAAVTEDTDETSHDGAAATSGGGVAQLHVTAFSGFSGAVIKVQDSANNTDWADIATFTTVAAVTSERVAVAGTVRRYLRVTADVTGTGSITYQCSFARR